MGMLVDALMWTDGAPPEACVYDEYSGHGMFAFPARVFKPRKSSAVITTESCTQYVPMSTTVVLHFAWWR